MQINSTTSLNTQYITDLQNKQATASSSFEDELTSQNEETSEITTSSVSEIVEPQERYYNVYTYENTKGMSSDDIDEYFQDKTEEQRIEIKSAVLISNSFSENDLANEAVFNEMKNSNQNYITNSRVGRRWPKENLDEIENETVRDFSLSSNSTMEELDSK